MTSITLPAKLETLGAYAFEGHAAQSVEIPASVEEIGEAPFGRMAPYVTVDAGNAYFSGSIINVEVKR